MLLFKPEKVARSTLEDRSTSTPSSAWATVRRRWPRPTSVACWRRA